VVSTTNYVGMHLEKIFITAQTSFIPVGVQYLHFFMTVLDHQFPTQNFLTRGVT
jgi:hypothetical protein